MLMKRERENVEETHTHIKPNNNKNVMHWSRKRDEFFKMKWERKKHTQTHTTHSQVTRLSVLCRIFSNNLKDIQWCAQCTNATYVIVETADSKTSVHSTHIYININTYNKCELKSSKFNREESWYFRMEWNEIPIFAAAKATHNNGKSTMNINERKKNETKIQTRQPFEWKWEK